MLNEEVRWNRGQNQERGRDHPDFQRNLSYSREFVKNCEGKLPRGMKVYIADSDALKNNLLYICWIPDSDIKMPRHGVPISMHQSHPDFIREFKNSFNACWGYAKKHDLNVVESNKVDIGNCFPKQEELINF